MSMKADLGGLALKALRKQMPTIVAFGLMFGLNIKEFLTPLWKTGNIGQAWTYWLAHGLPNIPGYLVMLVVAFAFTIAIEVGIQSQEEGYGERPDGYRSPRHD